MIGLNLVVSATGCDDLETDTVLSNIFGLKYDKKYFHIFLVSFLIIYISIRRW